MKKLLSIILLLSIISAPADKPNNKLLITSKFDFGKNVLTLKKTQIIRLGNCTLIHFTDEEWRLMLLAYPDMIERETINFFSKPIRKERPAHIKLNLNFIKNDKWISYLIEADDKSVSIYLTNNSKINPDIGQIYQSDLNPNLKENDKGILIYIPSKKSGEPCGWKFIKI